MPYRSLRPISFTCARSIPTLRAGYGAVYEMEDDQGRSLIVKEVAPPRSKGESHARKLRSYDVERHFYQAYAPKLFRQEGPAAYPVIPEAYELSGSGLGEDLSRRNSLPFLEKAAAPPPGIPLRRALAVCSKRPEDAGVPKSQRRRPDRGPGPGRPRLAGSVPCRLLGARPAAGLGSLGGRGPCFSNGGGSG